MANLSLICDFELIKAQLKAAYEKSADGYELLVLPTATDAQESVSLQELINSVSRCLGDSSVSEDSVTGALGGDESKLSAVKFKLNTVYLYIKKKGGEDKKEYAIALTVNLTDLFPADFPIKVNSVSLAVWNTEKKAVLEKLNFGTISNLLEDLSKSK